MSGRPYGTDPDPRAEGPRSGRQGPAARRRARRTGTGRSGGPRRGATGTVLALIAVVVLGAGAWSVPEVRSVLQDSFTERQQAYVELYFGKEPFFDGDELVVPVELVEHGDTGGRHTVRAWAEDAEGERLASRTESVTTKPGALIDVDIRLRLKGGAKKNADLVEVTLPGHPQRLRMHLR
ncbi:hypothetical protein [Streptomyces sp. NPDC093568]|uniref:hypothetical protein n=1 Tax=Streptomyces sp. NPDC093568 TaxID=3366041 RepID=UPI0037F66649